MIANRAFAFTLLAALAVAPAAFADDADQALAQSLFDEGVRLMDAGKYADACPKLAESQRLDPGGGTLINLAVCREKEGKFASAWTAFNEALSQSIKDNRKDREATAREHLTAIEPHLSKIIITVPQAAAVNGLEVKLDGVVIRQVAWGVATPADAGEHTLTVSAPQKRTTTQKIKLAKEQLLTVNVPALEDAPNEPTQPVGPTPQPTTPETPQGGAPMGAFIVGGVGVASLVVGVVTGGLAIGKRSASDAECPQDQCTQKGVDLNEEAKTLAWVSNITIGLGIVGIGVSIVWILVGGNSSSPPKPASSRLVPLIGPNALGVAGTF